MVGMDVVRFVSGGRGIVDFDLCKKNNKTKFVYSIYLYVCKYTCMYIFKKYVRIYLYLRMICINITYIS